MELLYEAIYPITLKFLVHNKENVLTLDDVFNHVIHEINERRVQGFDKWVHYAIETHVNDVLQRIHMKLDNLVRRTEIDQSIHALNIIMDPFTFAYFERHVDKCITMAEVIEHVLEQMNCNQSVDMWFHLVLRRHVGGIILRQRVDASKFYSKS